MCRCLLAAKVHTPVRYVEGMEAVPMDFIDSRDLHLTLSQSKMSGACLSQLESPPTTSPTSTGGLDVYYPDYVSPWISATCINARPLPNGRPTYASMLDCCKSAYAGQVCLSQ